MKLRLSILAALCAVFFAGVPSALAGGAAPAAGAEWPVVVTVITTDFSSSFAAVNPCTGGTGTVELAGQDVFHITDFGGGIFHLVDTQTGTLTFTPDDPSALTLAGHFTTTSNSQSNPPGLQFTVGGPFDVVAVGADGSRVVFHLISRTTRSPDGTVAVSFNVTRFECVSPAA
jgi:hypothetical protein